MRREFMASGKKKKERKKAERGKKKPILQK